MGKEDWEGLKNKNYFSGFTSLIFGLRGWGGVPSILRKTSSVLGSVTPSFFSVISKSSQNQAISPGELQTIQAKAKILLTNVNDIYYASLDTHEYGMPYADETILKTILRKLVELDLVTHQKIEKVLQFLPQHPECLEE